MKRLKSSIPVIILFFALFFTACEEEENQGAISDLAGTSWVADYNSNDVLVFSENTWARTIADENRFYEGTYEYGGSSQIIFAQHDDDGNVELRFDGKVIDENSITVASEPYTRQ